jgi:hypothetical protein
MPSPVFRSSRPDSWNVPRQNLHPSERRVVHGPILPMEQQRRGWLSRLFRKD